MKKVFYLLGITLLFSISALAQNEGISFQGLARNAAGEVLVSQKISLRLSILLNSESGAVTYSETRQTTTNPQGIFSLVVGDGTATSKTGNFSNIDWSAAAKFIKVEMDANAGTNFTLMGTSKLQSVPFAYYAFGVDAENVQGIVPVTSGGTGVASISDLKASLGLDQVNNTADASKPISTATQGALNTKVDKVTGKELSTNDYTTAEKTKLAAITGTNTGDQDLSAYATSVQLATKVDKEVGKGLSSNDFTSAEKTKLAAITGNVAGPVGPTGATGAIGPQGLPGATGATGPAGATGPQGLPGVAGVAGADGATGPTGATGPIGPAGLTWKGAWSATGTYAKDDAVGYNGASYFCLAPVSNSSATPTSDPTKWALLASQGATGLQGATGTRGVTGATGPTGATGAAGPQGIQGLTGPTGATGPAGVQGIAGPIGPAGLTWRGAWSATGTYAKDDVVGFNGASYFCLAPVSNSSTTPTSDPSKWALLASQGVDGPQGPTGAAGATGPQGPIGLTGPQGPTGAAGAQGLAGSDGATGPQGATGLTGATGATGPAGATGPQGPIGLTGPQGPIGATGAQGPAGSDGAVGPQGPAGPQGATGAAGLLSSGNAAGNTPYWDGTQWVVNSSNLFNNGSNIGIGTTSPSSKLQVVGSGPSGDRNNMLRIESNNNASLTLKNTNANAGGGEYQLFASSSPSNSALGAGSLAIYYDHPSNSAYRFSINTAGNVGIGTGMPTEKLDVAGNVKASGTLTSGTVTYPNTHGTANQVLSTTGSGTLAWTTPSSGGSGVPYTGATGAVNLGAYNLTVNEVTIGSGKVGTSGSSSNTIVGGAGVNRTFTSVVSNTAIGYNTLSSSTPGSSNTVVGAWALVSNTGAENSALGVGALERNLAGRDNTAIGYYSLRNNLTGSKNTALGHNSLTSGTPGEKNTMIGAEANVSGDFTNATALGYGAIVSASNTIQLGADGTNGTTAITNVKTSGTITAGAVTYPKTDGTNGQVLTTNGSGTLSWAAASSSSGVPYTGATQAVNLGVYDLTVNGMTIGSGKINSTATLNTIVGEYALNRTSANRGTDNTAIGYKAMGNESASTTSAGTKNTAVGSWTLVGNSGQENSAVGVGAMEQNQNGSQNTAMGGRALTANSTGSNNTAVGYNSLKSNSSGTKNTTIGSEANVASGTLTNATAIGYGAIVSANNTIQLGADGTNSTTAITNVKTSGTITAGAITYPNTAGTNGQVLTSNGSGTASWAAASGGVPYTGATGAVNLGAYDLTVNGIAIGKGLNSLASNTRVGVDALKSISTGAYNDAFGNSSMRDNTTGAGNSAFGFGTLSANSTGSFNTAIGLNALMSNTTGEQNIAIGAETLVYNSTGSGNTGIGFAAARGTTTGSANTSIGWRAGGNVTTGAKNTFLGYSAGNNVSTGTAGNTTGLNSVMIGYDVRPLADGDNNEIVISGYNGSAGTVGLGSNTTLIGSSTTTSARIMGALNLPNTTASSSTTTGALTVAGGVGIAGALNAGGTLTAGTVTYPNTHGTANQVLSTTGSGTLAWTTLATSSTHYIGEAYGGGIVFYVTTDGLHGLIAETQDQGNSTTWYDAQDRISTSSFHSAAGKLFTDWRLPTRNELNLLYSKKAIVGGFTDYVYWSSTEVSGTIAWLVNFNDGTEVNWFGKGAGYNVRAIRAF
jgi:carbonic anhydrase/acetyltransferase-like protein (isoleucine patch superfamily)